MTHAFAAPPSQPADRTQGNPAMVVQYGFRDEDDDDDDSQDGRRQSIFGGVLGQRQRNGSANMMPGGLDVISKLGSSFSNTLNLNHDNQYDDDDGDDSDDGSVSSKASVASRASRALKGLGGKLGFKMRNNRDSESDEEESSEEEESSDEEEDHDDDRSVSSRASKTIKKVTGKLSNALRVSGHRNSLGDEEDSEDEADLLSPTKKSSRATKGFFRKGWGHDHASIPLPNAPLRKVKSDSGEKLKNRIFRRSETAEPQPRQARRRPSDAPPTKRAPRRSKSDGPQKLAGEDDGHVSDLSDEDDSEHAHAAFNPHAQYTNPVPASGDAQAWSMNVTEEMWEEVTSDVEDDNSISRKKGWKMNVPKNLLADLPKTSQSKTALAK